MPAATEPASRNENGMTTIQKVLVAMMALMIGAGTNAQSAPPIVAS
jgi:hypothetical protein